MKGLRFAILSLIGWAILPDISLAGQKVLVLHLIEENWDSITEPVGIIVDYRWNFNQWKEFREKRKAKGRPANPDIKYEDELTEKYGWSKERTARETLDRFRGIVFATTTALVFYDFRHLGLHRGGEFGWGLAFSNSPFEIPLAAQGIELRDSSKIRFLPNKILCILREGGWIDLEVEGRRIRVGIGEAVKVFEKEEKVGPPMYDLPSWYPRASYRTRLSLHNLGWAEIQP